MLIKPYGDLVNKDNLDPYTQSYVGKVVDNNDPDKLKRVKVLIDLWDYLTDEELPWVRQKGDGSTGNSPDNTQHNIPEIGSEVRVSFPTNNPEEPEYSGIETTVANRCSVFDESYPHTYGNKDSAGNVIMHNKETGISVFQHNSGTTIQMDKDGALTITSVAGGCIHIDSMGNCTMNVPNMTINVDDTFKVNATTIDLFAKNKIVAQGAIISSTATNEIDNNAPILNMNGSSATNIPGVCNISNLQAGNGGSAIISDLVGKKFYYFEGGLLQGEL